MTFDLLPTITPWIIGFFALVAVGLLISAAAAVTAIAPHRRVRLARHETVRAYYGHQLSMGH